MFGSRQMANNTYVQPVPAELVIPESRKQYNADIATTTFGPIEKYVAANDNVPAPRAAAITASLRGKGIYPPERHGDWLQTYSGRQFWPMDPRADEVHIEDIAHALSLQCRYAGHCIQFYSVAEHSCHVALWLLRNYGPMTAMYGLLHDASEAYLVDVPRPVKPYLAGYKDAETKVQDAVHVRFGLGVGMPKAVKEADDRIIADELVNLRPMEWHARYDDPLGVKIGCWKPDAAEDEFLSMFVMLDRKMRETGRAAA